jgi:hypothetical protein
MYGLCIICFYSSFCKSNIESTKHEACAVLHIGKPGHVAQILVKKINIFSSLFMVKIEFLYVSLEQNWYFLFNIDINW